MVKIRAAVMLVVVLAVPLALVACTQEPPPRPMVEVVVDQVTLQSFQPKARYVGRLQAVDDVAIQARISGYLLSRDFREGEIIQAGSVLYTIDPSEFEAAVARAKADLAAAVAQQTNALRTYNRGLELVSKGAISEAEMDNFEAQKLETDAQIGAARAEVESAEVNLGYTTIIAPITGRIGRSAASVGDLVSANSGDLTSLVSQDPIDAQFQITEATYLKRVSVHLASGLDSEEVRRVEVGLELTDGTTYPLVGGIDYVGNRVDQTTGTMEARARIPNPNSVLVPGQYVRIVIQDTELEEALFLPQAAVQADQRGSFVLIVEEDVVARRDVVLGERLDDKVIVTSGINAGANVIVRGLQQVRPGMPVKIRALTREEQQG